MKRTVASREALRRELLGDVGDEAVLVALQRRDLLEGLLDGGHGGSQAAADARRRAW